MDINYLGVILAGIVSMAIGFLWYGPILGKPWMKERGISRENMQKMQKAMGKWYGVSFVVSLITAYVLAMVMGLAMNFYQGDKFTNGLTTAFWMWLGFVMPVQLTATIFGERRNFKLLSIDSGYQLVSLLAMGLVLALF